MLCLSLADHNVLLFSAEGSVPIHKEGMADAKVRGPSPWIVQVSWRLETSREC